jgi:hypothetical protein
VGLGFVFCGDGPEEKDFTFFLVPGRNSLLEMVGLADGEVQSGRHVDSTLKFGGFQR